MSVASASELEEPLTASVELEADHLYLPHAYSAGLTDVLPARRSREAPAIRQRPRQRRQPFASLAFAWREGLLDAFDHVGNGAILVGTKGRVISINAAARLHLGSGIAVVAGQLVAVDRDSNKALHGLIHSVRARPAHASAGVALAQPGKQPLLVHSVPIDHVAKDFGGAVALLLVVDPQRRQEPTLSLLRQVFGLTPAEARLAMGLTKGLDLHEIAEAHKVSVGTLRVQLKSVFAKTHTNRQAQLVVLLAKLSL